MSADDHALPGGRFAAGGLCQTCAEPWPCPTERIRRSLARMDSADRGPDSPTTEQRAAAILIEHCADGVLTAWCGADDCAWDAEQAATGNDPSLEDHAAHVAALLRAADVLAPDVPPAPDGYLLTAVPGVTFTPAEIAAVAALARETLGTATGPGGTPGGAG